MKTNKNKVYISIPIGGKEYTVKEDPFCMVLSSPYMGFNKTTQSDEVKYKDSYHPNIASVFRHIVKMEEKNCEISEIKQVCDKWDELLSEIESFAKSFGEDRASFFKNEV